MADILIDHEATAPRPAPWLDLILYIGLALSLILGIQYAWRGLLTQNSLLSTAAIFLINSFIFISVVGVVGVLRGRLTLQEIGLWPPRLPWGWIALAAALSIGLLPVRVVLGVLVQYLVTGSLQGLTSGLRMQMLTPHGPLLANFLVSFFLGGVLVPFAEELFFRGALFSWFRRRYSMWIAIMASSVLFALGHADTAAVVATSFVIGVLNAWLFERTRSIWVPYTVHLVNNGLAFILLYLALAIQNVISH
ncbi:MAG: type II CAAX endopeptidase family protein [Anaerolineaceae bacterium]|nr:type II CAAX endopeptidase family protein [Anaerolineaceae bacterium]